MSVKAILFDMDGVLINAKEWHYEALNKALQLFGMPIDRQAHLSTFDGLPTRKKLEMLWYTQNLPRELHEFINEMKQSYTESITYSLCKPTFGHQYALSKLKLDGYRMAVCSNSIRATVSLMMRLSKLEDYLEFQLSCQDVDSPKPAPDIYHEAMRRMGLSPEECLIIEDNDHGVQAAQASGGHVMRVVTPDDVTYDRIREAISSVQGN